MSTAVQSLSKAAERVTALVMSKLRGSDIHSEIDRLSVVSKTRARLEVGAVVGGLVGLAIVAASLGWIAMAAYFVLILYVGR